MSDLKLAYDILSSVYLDKAYASLELSKQIDKANKKEFVVSLVYGVIERDIELDYYIAKLCSKKPKNALIILLKLGMYQIKYMNSIPTYAAVSNTVDLCKEIKKQELTGFVNATLKNFANNKIELPKDKFERMSIEYSAPKFIVKEYVEEYGMDSAKAMLSKSNFNLENFRVTHKYSIEELITLLKENKIEYIDSLPNCVFAKNDKIMHDLYSAGKVTIQSKTSILTAEIVDPKDGDKVLDLCAAPGGKSIYMAELAKCEVTACDIHPHRVELIESYKRRVGVENVKTCVLDATKENKEFIDKFDKVLCDVPCSGLGVAKKKPDIYLNMTKESIKDLPNIQYKILNNAKLYVKKGGNLVYSTCTTLPQENKDVIAKFLSENSNFEKVYEKQFLQVDETLDGFYICQMVRR